MRDFGAWKDLILRKETENILVSYVLDSLVFQLNGSLFGFMGKIKCDYKAISVL